MRDVHQTWLRFSLVWIQRINILGDTNALLHMFVDSVYFEVQCGTITIDPEIDSEIQVYK